MNEFNKIIMIAKQPSLNSYYYDYYNYNYNYFVKIYFHYDIRIFWYTYLPSSLQYS